MRVMVSILGPRNFSRLLLAGALLALAAMAQARTDDPVSAKEPATAEQKSPADIDWAELEKAAPMFASEEAFQVYEKLNLIGKRKFEVAHGRRRLALAEAFWNQYPDDPRHLKALSFFLGADPMFIKSFPPESEIPQFMKNRTELRGEEVEAWEAYASFERSLPYDLEAELAWQRKGWEMVQTVLNDPAMSRADKEEAEFSLFARDFRWAQRYFWSTPRYYQSEGEAVEFWKPFRQRFDAHVIRYADSEELVGRARDYLGALTMAPDESLAGAAAAVEAGWRHLRDAPETDAHGLVAQGAGVKALRAAAAEQVRARGVVAGTEPLQMRFTALDGRQVDVSELRGKVVLIDFWATWCAPCVAEVPVMKAVYAKYRDQGFEIIGISFDDKEDPDKVRKFIAQHGVPWPQGIKDTLPENYTALYEVPSVPYVFLLDRSGKIVNRNERGRIANQVAYGEKLEPIVRKYLERDAG